MPPLVARGGAWCCCGKAGHNEAGSTALAAAEAQFVVALHMMPVYCLENRFFAAVAISSAMRLRITGLSKHWVEQMIFVRAGSSDDLNSAFAAMMQERPDAFSMTGDPLHQLHVPWSGQTVAWMVIFFVPSAAASSAYLTVRETLCGLLDWARQPRSSNPSGLSRRPLVREGNYPNISDTWLAPDI
jgi:hypothetical protein